MSAARKSAFNTNGAKAAISICWRQMRPDLSGDESREERLAWIADYLGLDKLESTRALSDYQLGSVAGEMKRLVGIQSPKSKVQGPRSETFGNVVQFPAREKNPVAMAPGSDKGETVFLSSPELTYTLEKLLSYIGWPVADREAFLTKRFGTTNLKMLTFAKATVAVNTFLRIAAHQDLKKRKGADKPVSRKEINKYVPMLKELLSIDRQN